MPESLNFFAIGGTPQSRSLWAKQLDFLLAVMGFNIGLGNMLRFPYLCLNNGGGAFLIPYFFFLFCFGTPLFLMELGLGQYSGLSPIRFWKTMCPIFQGVGWCYIVNCAVFNVYFNMQISWILNYLVFSLQKNLPWESCNNYWNTPQCHVSASAQNLTNDDDDLANISSACHFGSADRRISGAEEFWEHRLLHISTGLTDVGPIQWNILLGIVVTWVLIYLCLIKGIETMGKVVYVTVLVPYLILLILLIRGLVQPGGTSGIRFYLTVDWSRLMEPDVWIQAAQQIFWSLAPCWGITISLASHNTFNNNIFRDACLLPFLSGMSSFFAGFVTFAFAGSIAHRLDQPITCVLKTGPGLAFNVYPDAFSSLPGSPFWSAIFFLLLLFLGLDSSIASFETVYHGIVDLHPKLFKRYEWLTKAIFCIFSFIPAIPMTTRAGHYIYQLVDWYQMALFCFVALSQVIGVSYFYGANRLRENIKEMTGRKISYAWSFLWRFFIPIVLLIMQMIILVNFKPVVYGNYHYSIGAIIFGWVLAVFMFLPVPTFVIWSIGKALWRRHHMPPDGRPTVWKLVQELTKPTSEWEMKAEMARNKNHDTPCESLLLESVEPNGELGRLD